MWLTEKISNIFKSDKNKNSDSKSSMSKIMGKISQSLDGTNNNVSTNRVQSYFLVSSVLLMILSIISIEMTNAIIAWNTSKPYSISNEFIVVFGMVLSHHLAVLFNRNKPKDDSSVEQTDVTTITEDSKTKISTITETNKPEIKSDLSTTDLSTTDLNVPPLDINNPPIK